MSFPQDDIDDAQVGTSPSYFLSALIPSQNVIYIPCDETAMGTEHAHPSPFNLRPPPLGSDGNGDDTDRLPVGGYSPFDEKDLPGGHVARFKSYRAAWSTCLDRVEVRVAPFIRSVPMFATFYF
jgi:hypothetical protein